MSASAPLPSALSGLPWSRVVLAALAPWPGLALLWFTAPVTVLLPGRGTAWALQDHPVAFAVASVLAGLPLLALALLSRTRSGVMRRVLRVGTVATVLVWGLFTVLCIAGMERPPLPFLALLLGIVAPLLVLAAAALGYALGK